MLTRTYNAARLFDIRHLCLTLRAPQDAALLYIYQLILVCQIRDNPAIVFIRFLKGAEDRVFCMAGHRLQRSAARLTDSGLI